MGLSCVLLALIWPEATRCETGPPVFYVTKELRMDMTNLPAELQAFLDGWTASSNTTKQGFVELVETLSSKKELDFGFKARPGVSYSLRVKPRSGERTVLGLIDIIDDDPDNRWLSVCFYADLIQDPEDKGDLIPGGLLGEDGYCFDLDEYEPRDVAYIQERFQEACRQVIGHPA